MFELALYWLGSEVICDITIGHRRVPAARLTGKCRLLKSFQGKLLLPNNTIQKHTILHTSETAFYLQRTVACPDIHTTKNSSSIIVSGMKEQNCPGLMESFFRPSVSLLFSSFKSVLAGLKLMDETVKKVPDYCLCCNADICCTRVILER